MAEAQLKEARAQLDQCSDHAPVDGVVVDVLANPGEFMSLAVPAPLLQLAPDAKVQVRAEIEPRNLPRVCLAQPASVIVDAFQNRVIHAQVELINPVISNRTLFMAGNGGRSPDVARLILSLENDGTNLPVGLPVTVLFDPCPKAAN